MGYIYTNFIPDQVIIPHMRISLAITVFNEEANIRRLFASILEQTRVPDEVTVCDGGSTDNTVAIMSEYSDQLPLRVLVRPGVNISTGRNVADVRRKLEKPFCGNTPDELPSPPSVLNAAL